MTRLAYRRERHEREFPDGTSGEGRTVEPSPWAAGESYYSNPDRNERILFFLSLGLLGLAGLLLLVVTAYSVG